MKRATIFLFLVLLAVLSLGKGISSFTAGLITFLKR
jgi:hypothetical protein